MTGIYDDGATYGPTPNATDFDAREAAEAAAEAEEGERRHYTQRIANLEYGIEGVLEKLEDLAERADDIDTSLATAIRNERRFLYSYYNPQHPDA